MFYLDLFTQQMLDNIFLSNIKLKEISDCAARVDNCCLLDLYIGVLAQPGYVIAESFGKQLLVPFQQYLHALFVSRNILLASAGVYPISCYYLEKQRQENFNIRSI